MKRNNNKTSSTPSLGGGGGMDLSERTSQHSPGSAGSRPNCSNDDDDDDGVRSDGGGGNSHRNGSNSNGHNNHHHNNNDDEPPMDYSRTHHHHHAANHLGHHLTGASAPDPMVAQNLMVTARKSSPPADVKSEPMDTTATPNTTVATVNSGGAYADDSNDSAADFTGVHPAIGMSEPDDTSYQSHHSYLDSKFFAAAGATFNFSMAAAMAADSLAGEKRSIFLLNALSTEFINHPKYISHKISVLYYLITT